MGDTKKQRKKYTRPNHPWIKGRIEDEKVLQKEYGIPNKKEIYKMSTILKNIKDQVKKISASRGDQIEKEKKQLTERLYSLGLTDDKSLSNALVMNVRNIMDRRLQTIVYKKHLARSVIQARQFITHGHILVGDHKITSPSYLVKRQDMDRISFITSSSLFSQDNPERMSEEEILKKETHKKQKEIEARKEAEALKKQAEEEAAMLKAEEIEQAEKEEIA
ncbi:30S ribosomal protein S4 [Candidatus Woesearchaeota archaeon]|nr:30S ribosomal protein S4 [Candidatus Woesearchaeota archaeon]